MKDLTVTNGSGAEGDISNYHRKPCHNANKGMKIEIIEPINCVFIQNSICIYCVSTGDSNLLLESRRDSNMYQPPPPSDVSKMKDNCIKEQKVFALIREILGKIWAQNKSNCFLHISEIQSMYEKGK